MSSSTLAAPQRILTRDQLLPYADELLAAKAGVPGSQGDVSRIRTILKSIPDEMTLAEAKQYLAEGTHFAKGSMAPKVQAITWFLENGGKQALITNPENIGRALRGETGTWIVP